MLPHHIFLTLIGTSIQATCNRAIPSPKRTLPPKTTDSLPAVTVWVAAGVSNYSGVYILICEMSLHFYCREYLCKSNWKRPGRASTWWKKCWYENLFQIFRCLSVGQTRASEPCNFGGSRNGAATGALARYNMTRVDLKTFTFSGGSKSPSIDYAVLGPLPKRLQFTMIKNSDFSGSVETNPHKFRHYISEYWHIKTE